MGKNLQNSLVAGIVSLSAVALLYGFTDTVPLGKGNPSLKMEAAHWGAGTTARQTIDVMSQAKSLTGGSGRHETFPAFVEGKTGYGGTPHERGASTAALRARVN